MEKGVALIVGICVGVEMANCTKILQRCDKQFEGFTLVELSIVIIIIGFLISGIASGTSLIKQAKLHALINEFTEYKTAYYGFKLKYDAIPGDMPNAESYWPDCSDTPGICIGNGNGVVQWFGGVSLDETVLAIRQLYLAGLIVNGGSHSVPGNYSDEDIQSYFFPESKVGCCLYIAGPVAAWGNTIYFPDHTSPWAATQQNAIFLIIATGFSARGIISPTDSFNIDMKSDDGKAGATFSGASTGLIRAVNTGTCLASADDYDLTEIQNVCMLGSQLD